MLKSCSKGLVAGATLVLSQMAGATTLNGAYWNWWELVDGAQGGYVSGGVWAELDKAPAVQSGNNVTLAPNTSLCQDNIDNNDAGGIEYWCDAGKWIEMLSYENTEVPQGTDPYVETFTGCFTNDEMPAGVTVSAFVKVLSADFSQTYAEEFQSSTCWDISFDILGDATVQVQKGFQVWGPNADPRDGDPGSVTAVMGITQLPTPGNFAEGIPATPIWALFGMAGLLALLGIRRRR